jgi:hypothetical protein
MEREGGREDEGECEGQGDEREKRGTTDEERVL